MSQTVKNGGGSTLPPACSSQHSASQSFLISRRIRSRVLYTPVTTVIARMSQYTSNTSTAQATKIAPGNLKTIGIHAGAARRIQVIAPGAASKKRAPNWRTACSQAGAGGCASITAIDRLCPPHSWGGGAAAPEGLAEYGKVGGLCIQHAKPSALRRPDFRGRRAQFGRAGGR